jgi:hypothetical protein
MWRSRVPVCAVLVLLSCGTVLWWECNRRWLATYYMTHYIAQRAPVDVTTYYMAASQTGRVATTSPNLRPLLSWFTTRSTGRAPTLAFVAYPTLIPCPTLPLCHKYILYLYLYPRRRKVHGRLGIDGICGTIYVLCCCKRTGTQLSAHTAHHNPFFRNLETCLKKLNGKHDAPQEGCSVSGCSCCCQAPA